MELQGNENTNFVGTINADREESSGLKFGGEQFASSKKTLMAAYDLWKMF